MALSRALRDKIRAKLKEKSTWAGLGVVLAVAGLPVPPGVVEQVALAVAGAIGVYEVMRKEGEGK